MTLRPVPELTAALRRLPGADRVLSCIAAAGADVYLVGGAVRDLWLGGAPLDLDLVVVGDPAPLAVALGADVRAHDRFGTATVRGEGGARYDLARARTETYPSPGALPQVHAAGIREDLGRRDFSVNAIALGLSGPDAGRVLSAPDGERDLAARRLRVLHPASFRDDPTRLLRLARYSARLRFSVEPETAALARAALGDGALATVTAPRIGSELVLLGSEPDPVAAFAALRELGIDEAIAPGFGLTAADQDAARRALAQLPADGDPVALMLGLAVGDSPPSRRKIAQLGLSATRRDAALAVAQSPSGLAHALSGATRPSQVDRVLARAPVEAVAVAAGLAPAHAAARAGDWLRGGRHTTLKITGTDMIAAGVPQGPGIAAGLRAARAAQLDGEAPTREEQLAVALRAAVSV